MVDGTSSDLVVECRCQLTPAGEPAELLIFQNGLTVAISASGIASYKSPENFGDPLGRGFIDSAEVAGLELIPGTEGHFVNHIQSGYVELTDGRVMLILPNQVRVFQSRESALYNRDVVAVLSLNS